MLTEATATFGRFPYLLRRRLAEDPRCFAGDLASRAMEGDRDLVKQLRRWQRYDSLAVDLWYNRIGKILVEGVDRIICHPYRCFFQIALERACR